MELIGCYLITMNTNISEVYFFLNAQMNCRKEFKHGAPWGISSQESGNLNGETSPGGSEIGQTLERIIIWLD